MPGIVGLITRQHRLDARSALHKMLAAICHETFYSSGTWADESLQIYVGWTALKGSFSDGMPLHNERGDVSLVFSGNEYSDPQTSLQLRRHGHTLGPAESDYLVHLYEEDPNFFQYLNGMFHGLIADRARGSVTLFNDRYGMHRLYYYQSKDAFYFATEAKAILAVCSELRTFSPTALGELVAFSCVLGNRTIFKNIDVLPAASTWTFKNGCLDRKSAYFDPEEWENQTQLGMEDFHQELRMTLLNTLPRYFGGQQKMAIAMTGGLDTRVILACHQPAPGDLPSYTIGSAFRDSQDVRLGRQIARTCQQRHEVITVGDEFLRRFPRYAERSIYLTEGTVDVYRASDLYVSEAVRKIAPAKIVGTYGSEILRHATMFKPTKPVEGLFCPDVLSHVEAAGDAYASLRQQQPVTFAAFRQSPWYHHGILALEQSQLTVRSPFMDNEFVRTAYRAPKVSTTDDVRLRLIDARNSVLGRFRSDRGVGGNGWSLASNLARAYQEFTFKAEYAYDYGMPRVLTSIDHVLSKLHLERLFLGRHKMLHFRVWYRDQLSDYVRQILLDPLTLSRPYLQRKAVEAVVKHHLKGTRNYTTAIHKLLTLELAHRLFVDGPCERAAKLPKGDS
jgi:asparagine synthase (glutamine-hydrolysing)